MSFHQVLTSSRALSPVLIAIALTLANSSLSPGEMPLNFLSRSSCLSSPPANHLSSYASCAGQGDFRLVLYDLLFLDALTRILFEYMLRDRYVKKLFRICRSEL